MKSKTDVAPSIISRRHFGALAAITGVGIAIKPVSTAAKQSSQDGINISCGYVQGPNTYYEHLKPAQQTNKPTIVMVPGGAHTGSCYQVTADGRQGWAFDFVTMGYPVVVLDWPATGRSGYIADPNVNGEIVCAGIGKVIESIAQPVVLMTHSMSGAYGWKVLEKYGQHVSRLVAIAPGPPGNIQPPADVVSETPEKIVIRGTTNYTLNRTVPFVSTQGFVVGKLIGKSELFPRELTASYTASLIPIPAKLLQQRLNIHGTQLKVEDLRYYRDKPVVVVTGTNDTDHPKDIDQKTVDWLKSNGTKVDYYYLGDKGVAGNGHMMMMEQNSDVIAKLIAGWIG